MTYLQISCYTNKHLTDGSSDPVKINVAKYILLIIKIKMVLQVFYCAIGIVVSA